MNEEIINGIACEEPFPHMIINNLYNEEELKLIWEELNFLKLKIMVELYLEPMLLLFNWMEYLGIIVKCLIF